MQTLSRAWVWTVIGIVAIIVIVLVSLFWFLPKKAGAPGIPLFAPDGQVVAGFPQDLLLDSGGSITKSYSIPNGATTSQYTVEWISSSSPSSLLAGYLIYFSGNGWRIINQSSDAGPVQSVYAASASGTANLSITSQGFGSDAVLSYVPAPQTVAIVPPSGFPLFLIPDFSSKLIAAQGDASSSVVVFLSLTDLKTLTEALTSGLMSRNWKVLQNQETTSSVALEGSSENADIFAFLNVDPQGRTKVLIHYEMH
jgi:hypothetical protein